MARLYGLEPGKVYDRWAGISEIVYGVALRERMLLPPGIFRQAIKEMRPIIIYCRPSDIVLDENLLKQLEKPHKSLDHIQRITENKEIIRAIYDTLALRTLPRLGCLVVKYTYNPKNTIEALIETGATRHEH